MKWILFSFVSFWMIGSTQFENSVKTSQQQLAVGSHEWTLVSIAGDTSWSHLPDRIPSINFDSEKSRVSGFGGCNRFGGSYTQAGDSIRFSPLFSTQMYCHESQPTESALLDALQRADKIVISNNQLRLFAGSAELLLFEKKS
ncbi:MAG: META domain-containing protein [Chitinophagaceae bacterium]